MTHGDAAAHTRLGGLHQTSIAAAAALQAAPEMLSSRCRSCCLPGTCACTFGAAALPTCPPAHLSTCPPPSLRVSVSHLTSATRHPTYQLQPWLIPSPYIYCGISVNINFNPGECRRRPPGRRRSANTVTDPVRCSAVRFPAQPRMWAGRSLAAESAASNVASGFYSTCRSPSAPDAGSNERRPPASAANQALMTLSSASRPPSPRATLLPYFPTCAEPFSRHQLGELRYCRVFRCRAVFLLRNHDCATSPCGHVLGAHTLGDPSRRHEDAP